MHYIKFISERDQMSQVFFPFAKYVGSLAILTLSIQIRLFVHPIGIRSKAVFRPEDHLLCSESEA